MKAVRFDHVGAVGQIVLCSPPDNRLGLRFAEELRVAVHRAGGSGVRALLVRAEGPNFGTGGDVVAWPGRDVNWFHAFIGEVNHAYRALEALRVPTIAAVRGKAVGGHFELALHCDVIVAADSASFHAIEGNTGMVPLAGGLQRLAERIGRSRAIQLYLLGEPMAGSEAGSSGLANLVVQDAELDATATDLAERLAAGPTQAYGAARALLKAWSSGGVAGADELMLDLTMRLFDTEDAQRAFAALKEETEAGGSKADCEASARMRFLGR